MKAEETVLSKEEAREVSGSSQGGWSGGHRCGMCGSEMKFDRMQQGSSPAVYRCPVCGNEDVFPS